MPPNSTSLRYLGSKLHAAVAEVFETLTSSTNRSLLSIVERGLEVYNSPLTGLMVYTGKAMAPTLNPAVGSSVAAATAEVPSAEKLLVRWLRRPSSRNVFPNDVVAFQSPWNNTTSGEQIAPNVLVRRVAAAEQHEMVSDDPEEVSFFLPEGTCWVLADNEAVDVPTAGDSRSFGPLPYNLIIGRVLYHARNAHDHGVMHNSAEAMDADAPVLAAELDLDKLISIKERDASSSQN